MDAADRLIQRLEQRAEQARRVKKVLADDPDLAEKVVRMIVASSNGEEPASRKREGRKRSGPTMAERVEAYFRERHNEWATVGEVSKAVGVAEGSVRSVFYSTRRDAYHNRTHPTRKGAKQFRLTETSDT